LTEWIDVRIVGDEILDERHQLYDQFLIDLCLWFAAGEDRPRLEEMDVRWGELLARATAQNVDRLLAHYFTSPPLVARMPWRMARDLLQASRRRAARNAAAVRDLQAALARSGIPSLARKGVVYGRLFYGDWGLRVQGDNDLFVPPAASETAAQVLWQEGYRTGIWSAETGAVEPLPRKRLLMYFLNPDHVPPAAKPVSGPFTEAISVDVATHLSWYGSPYAAVERLLDRDFETPSQVEGLKTLSSLGHFFDCLFHGYREAYFENPLAGGMNVNLRKFLDLWLIWGSLDACAREAARETVLELGLAPVAGWLATHLDDLFGADLLSGLGLCGRYDRREANTWRSDAGEVRTWHGSIRDRLFARARRAPSAHREPHSPNGP
jgi:hypothetical protein